MVKCEVCDIDGKETISIIRYDNMNLCAQHADMILLALVKHINYLIDHGGIPTRDGDTGKLLAAIVPFEGLA